MRTINYLTLILSFSLLFASCKKNEDAAENTPTPTPAVSQEYTVDMYLNYSGNLRDGSIVRYNDKDGVEQQETLDKTKTEWKKTIVVKKGFIVLVKGEFKVAIGGDYEFEAGSNGKTKDGSDFMGGQTKSKISGVTKEITYLVTYKETI